MVGYIVSSDYYNVWLTDPSPFESATVNTSLIVCTTAPNTVRPDCNPTISMKWEVNLLVLWGWDVCVARSTWNVPVGCWHARHISTHGERRVFVCLQCYLRGAIFSQIPLRPCKKMVFGTQTLRIPHNLDLICLDWRHFDK